MRLSYCGAHETELPTFQMLEGDVIGKNPRENLRPRYSYPKHISVPQTPLALKYRRANDSTPSAITKSSQPTALQNVRQRVLKEVEEAHRTNIYRSLERRLLVAKNLGDQRLIGLLESELQQLV